MPVQDTQMNGLIQRRVVIKGLAGLWLLACGSACASPVSSPGTATSTAASATPHSSDNVVHVYRGHTDRVTSVAWSPDGNYIASGSLDKTVQIWNATTGEHSYTYRGHSAAVNAVAWSPDSSSIASGSLDQTVQVWDATTGAPDFTYQGHTDIVDTVAWSPDGSRIASGSRDQTVQIWNATIGARVHIYRGHVNTVTTLAWSHYGRRIAAVTQQYCSDACGVVLFWDATTGRNVSFYTSIPVFALAWSPDDTRIVTATITNLVQILQVS